MLSPAALRVLADAALLVPALLALAIGGREGVKRTQPARMNCDGIAPYYQVIEHLSLDAIWNGRGSRS